jgi:hypothetical protein
VCRTSAAPTAPDRSGTTASNAPAGPPSSTAHRYPVAVENLNDEAINRKVDEAYWVKYAGEGSSLREMVSPQVRQYTMRITPQ